MSVVAYFWRGQYSDITQQSLGTLKDGLVNSFGFSLVGIPAYHTFGDNGIAASALFREGLVGLVAKDGTARIVAHLYKGVDVAALKLFIKATLGLSNETILEDSQENG